MRYSGDGYAVDILSHSAVKYLQGGRSITFSSEPLARTSRDGKARWVLTLYVRRPLRWDDSEGREITDADEERAILSRVETALKAKIGDYELARDAS